MNNKTKKFIIFTLIAAISVSVVSFAKSNKSIIVADRPQAQQTTNQPFVRGVTANSKNFRIPALVTLDDGTLLAAADVRYNKTRDGGGLDTVVAYSDDNGDNWTSYVANYLGDNGNKFSIKSTAFIDPELLTDGKNVWMITTFYPGNRNLNIRTGIKAATKGNAFNDDGSLKLSSNHGKDYNYKVNLDNFKDGFSAVVSNDGKDSGYKIDEYFYLYDSDNKQVGNIFYIKSKMSFSVVPTTYLYMTKSVDGGKTFGTPTLINLKQSDESFYGVAPGRGLCTKDGTLIFSTYTYAGTNKMESSFIFSKDNGKTWKRSANIESKDTFMYSSENQIVELENGNLRCFFRNNSNKICYVDAVACNDNYIWKQVIVTDIEATSSCMLSAINCSYENKNYILVSCPTGGKRSCGKIFAFEILNDSGEMKLVKITDINDSAFMYSCMTVMPNEKIGMLYEYGNGKITFIKYDKTQLIK